jgi:hypothetical protein
MIRTIARFTCAAAVAAAVGGPRLGAAEAPGTIYVAVAKDDKPVPGLTAKNFEIQVSGRLQPVISAEPASEPLSLVIFVQTRVDDTPLTRSAIRSILALVRQANPDARVGLVTTAAAPTFVSVTSQAVLLERTIGTLFADSNIGSIVERLPELARVLSQEPNRRRVIVSITPPGVTNGAQLSPETAPSLQHCGCELWGLVVAQVGGTLLDRDDVLSNLITVSGGRRANVFGAPLLDAASQLMASLMLAQYKVQFEHPDSKQPLNLRVGVHTHLTGLQVYAPGWTID